MAVKEWFRRLQPVQLYLVLFFTTTFFLVEIVASHVTHSLTLLLNAYHMLCNIVALIGCIASIKYTYREKYSSNCSSLRNSAICINGEEQGSATSLSTKTKESWSDRRMKNTFGWARIDIVTMLVCFVFLASFCFSILMEAFQTLVHIDHLDEMHHPLPVLCIGASGVLLNVVCYILIGGFTFNQGIFLHVTKSGDVILCRNVSSQEAKDGEQQLSAQTRRSPLALPKSQGFREMCRDIFGCIFVILVSILVYFTDSGVAKYIDPVFAIISSISLFVLCYPYMKESGMILLQTIPNHINIDSLKRELLEAFPGIVNVHDLHVWQLAGDKIISTAHVIFLDPKVYASIKDQVTAFFVEMGITQVTVQPEFHKMKPHMDRTDCLIRCQDEHCSSSQCCSRENFLDEDTCKSEKDSQSISRRYEKKEIIPASSTINLERFTVYKEEVPKQLTSDTTLEMSGHDSSSCENTRRPADQDRDQNTRDIDTDNSSCKMSDNTPVRTPVAVGSNLGHDVVS
ncbi:PREDICTED: zinc/cadmium resistance protein [Dinoponera quadriceps]|uniref:Zinc/cadmium resistance protein n=1 Tax=Dinoponera quadriceps TaxID=609295 RepID=A0A6P3WYV4_DINQU|nr:PREDICTED: zinc/cadmium resistance protein [Dinoponera quadriceps]XP_014471301.1 PREDICTED: zinc/cadmium resistance protein [Dinoponera quadriceps]XP_014471302.1 PREDICTED: zinc/cadmium resistance protein [Dinoponera quadriceps]XP_014471303.1 PREDICTED: zinc/cadmium resistance protein [Dinoponera quadriceps]